MFLWLLAFILLLVYMCVLRNWSLSSIHECYVIDTDINVFYFLGLFIYSIQVTGVHSDKSVFISFIHISETALYLNVLLQSKPFTLHWWPVCFLAEALQWSVRQKSAAEVRSSTCMLSLFLITSIHLLTFCVGDHCACKYNWNHSINVLNCGR